MDKKQIAGAGGGGGGQQTVVAQAAGGGFVNPDNLDSRQVVRIIDMLGEGEIEGFPSARGFTPGTAAYDNAIKKDIYFNNTPLLRASADPNNVQTSDFNFDLTNAGFEYRSGTQNQSYTQNIGDANQQTFVVGLKVTKDVPVTRSITDTDVNAVRVTIGTPALQKFEANGDINGRTIEYQIQVSYSGGPFTTVVSSDISGRTPDLISASTALI